MLHIRLVISGLPLALSACFRCIDADGNVMIVCFDVVQLGYKIKFK